MKWKDVGQGFKTATVHKGFTNVYLVTHKTNNYVHCVFLNQYDADNYMRDKITSPDEWHVLTRVID